MRLDIWEECIADELECKDKVSTKVQKGVKIEYEDQWQEGHEEHANHWDSGVDKKYKTNSMWKQGGQVASKEWESGQFKPEADGGASRQGDCIYSRLMRSWQRSNWRALKIKIVAASGMNGTALSQRYDRAIFLHALPWFYHTIALRVV